MPNPEGGADSVLIICTWQGLSKIHLDADGKPIDSKDGKAAGDHTPCNFASTSAPFSLSPVPPLAPPRLTNFSAGLQSAAHAPLLKRFTPANPRGPPASRIA